jgi:two-component system response regulator
MHNNHTSDPDLPIILLVDDDPDDRLLMQEALEEANLKCTFRTAENGEDLMDYLRNEGPYEGKNLTEYPQLIILDLNMPRMDGREALRHLKSSPGLKQIPVVVLSTSKSDQDIQITYDLGCSSYMTKPDSFPDLVKRVQVIFEYWFKASQLPSSAEITISVNKESYKEIA